MLKNCCCVILQIFFYVFLSDHLFADLFVLCLFPFFILLHSYGQFVLVVYYYDTSKQISRDMGTY